MKTLIIKTGALGDVVRTTVLLKEIEGEIYWLTKRNASDLLKTKKIKEVLFLEDSNLEEMLKKVSFDQIISLEEDPIILRMLKNVKYKKIIGLFLNDKNEIDYTKDSSYWFDMSLSSKFGKAEADKIKKNNRLSVPEILIKMIGKKWKDQEYDIATSQKAVKGIVGLVNISTSVWPSKLWSGYEKLGEVLKKEGYEVRFIKMKDTLKEHIKDINECEIIVCGDTLDTHIALALKKKVVCIFNCTSPDEIYGYGRMIKVVSPLYDKYFYVKEYSKEATDAVSLDEVYSAFKKVLKV